MFLFIFASYSFRPVEANSLSEDLFKVAAGSGECITWFRRTERFGLLLQNMESMDFPESSILLLDMPPSVTIHRNTLIYFAPLRKTLELAPAGCSSSNPFQVSFILVLEIRWVMSIPSSSASLKSTCKISLSWIAECRCLLWRMSA